MIIVRLFRWFLGWVCFSVSENQYEVFLSKAGNLLWQVEKKQNQMTARCRAKNYVKAARIARQSGCRIGLLKKAGFPFYFHRYHLRYGILIGIAITSCLLFFSTFFVWSIDVHGNATLTNAQILNEALAYGLHEGAPRWTFDEREVEYQLQKKFPQIAWISINRAGTHYDIEISESTLKPQIEDDKTPCNVVSDYDAIVRSIIPYSGEQTVAVGDVVTKNQMLVSGIKEFENSEVVYYAHARAKVIGEVEQSFDYSSPLYTTAMRKNGEIASRKQIRLFGITIPLYIKDVPENCIFNHTESTQVKIFGVSLPIYMETKIYDVYEAEQIEGDAEEIKRILSNEAKEKEAELFKDSKILQRTFSYEEAGDHMVLHTVYLAEREIGRQIPIVETKGEN